MFFQREKDALEPVILTSEPKQNKEALPRWHPIHIWGKAGTAQNKESREIVQWPDPNCKTKN
jgi:hypothetical protein